MYVWLCKVWSLKAPATVARDYRQESVMPSLKSNNRIASHHLAGWQGGTRGAMIVSWSFFFLLVHTKREVAETKKQDYPAGSVDR